MPMTPRAPASLIIATRESALALTQTQHIRQRLLELYPACSIELLGMTTQGDRILDQPLADIGGKGLFIKELEQAMQDGRADLAVHSLKDMPMDLVSGFALAAITVREDARDAFISNRYPDIGALPAGAVVGTSSLRREAQLRERFPGLVVQPLRGNVNTRLRKLDEGQYDAIVLAAAGLKRLGLASRITALMSFEHSLPAVGQGALAIECRADRAELIEVLAPLNDADTALCTRAERAFSRKLAGSCRAPLAAHARWVNGHLELNGLIASRDGRQVMRAAGKSDGADPEAFGTAIADELLERGAAAVLADS